MATTSDEQAAGQHYLVCGIQDCQKNGQFYCNDCHQPMCGQCKDEHRKSSNTKSHDIVLYRQRKHQLPVEKCSLHPTKNVDIFCKECKTPLCLKCFLMKEHEGHEFDDLEEIFTEKYALWHGEFSKIQKYFLPTSEGLKTDVEEDVREIHIVMESIRTSMKAEAESLKNLIDDVTSEKIEQTHSMEKSLLKILKLQEKTYDDYITYLEKVSDEFQDYLSATNQKLLISETLKIQSIPETPKLVLPVFAAGQLNKKDVIKLLGTINVPNAEPETRKIKPLDAVSSYIKIIEEQLEQTKEKHYINQPLSLSSSATKVREYGVPGVNNASHVSLDKSGRLWVSDNLNNLVQVNLQGDLLQKIQINGAFSGYHSATQDGDLIYTDRVKGTIHRITQDRKITEFIKTKDWIPLSIHSSCINEDILVGMFRDKEAKVIRYNKVGKEMHTIRTDNQGHQLYDSPLYITENICCDVCTSDFNKGAVVVVNKSGQHRFSYTGQWSEFRPFGICTDVLGHILVCDRVKESIHLLDQDGGFLSLILSKQQCMGYPRGICVDDENNLRVGKYKTNKVTVYKYLQ